MIVTLSDDFQYKKILFGTKSCHCSRIVTITGVTVTDRACGITGWNIWREISRHDWITSYLPISWRTWAWSRSPARFAACAARGGARWRSIASRSTACPRTSSRTGTSRDGSKVTVVIGADGKSQIRQCFGFCTADFWSLLAYEFSWTKTQTLPNLRFSISSGYDWWVMPAPLSNASISKIAVQWGPENSNCDQRNVSQLCWGCNVSSCLLSLGMR